MFGRSGPAIATLTLIAHLAVSWVFAPWHRAVEHSVAPEPAARGDLKSGRHCGCRHHTRPAAASCESTANQTGDPSSPRPVDQHDDCHVCQVLAQFCTAPQLSELTATAERVEAYRPHHAAQPLLGVLFDPVSRGPPASA